MENPVAARRNVELAPPVPVQTTKGDDAAAPSGKPAGTPFARDEKMNWATQPLYLFCPNVKSCICSLVCPWWNLLTGIYVKVRLSLSLSLTLVLVLTTCIARASRSRSPRRRTRAF